MNNFANSGSVIVPAAQYVRMSDEAQQYSIENQKAAIQEYAERHGFRVIKTYADEGRSGVVAKRRTGLQQLLKDVINGDTGYRAILVYDVSRWGRFPNTDEAAHYEFLCLQAGIPLHYCAEQFENDGSASSSILKALKRSMAAEFSRELGEKVFRGKCRLVQMGFWVGGRPGYGYRRMMVSADGKRKQVLKLGECKSLTTYRITLVPGPRSEVERVRQIFSMAIEGKGCTAIARELNRAGVQLNGKPWTCTDVSNIVKHPKYAGYNVWNRGSQRLRKNRVPVKPECWILKPRAFPAIVDQETFDRAQAALPRRADALWSDKEILKRLRRLFTTHGWLSEGLILKSRGMPAANTLHRHFGTYRDMYELIGYDAPDEDLFGNKQAEDSMQLRRRLVRRIKRMFPTHVSITHLPNRHRSILRIDEDLLVSVLLCRIEQPRGEKPHWLVDPNPAERDFITLLCRLDRSRKRIISYHLFPAIDFPGGTHNSGKADPWLKTGVRLANLSDFYDAVKELWRRRAAAFRARKAFEKCSMNAESSSNAF